jgi:hypothetical protein
LTSTSCKENPPEEVKTLLLSLGTALLLAGCGGGVEETGKTPAASAGVGSGAQGTGNLAGSSFEATAAGSGWMALEFSADQKVRVSTKVPDSTEGSRWTEGTYNVAGDQVIVTIQGDPAIFTHSGNTLTGSLRGDRVTFTRK